MPKPTAASPILSPGVSVAIGSGEDADYEGFHDDDSQLSLGRDPELAELERRLNDEVDDEFFEDPRRFHTLHRVIDVLGLQLVGSSSDNRRGDDKVSDINKNPAYRALKEQQQLVENAIEHMAMIHCADLNGSVVQVGRVARRFNDAVQQVRSLRKQVRDIQDTIGASNTDATDQANQNGGKKNQQVGQTAAAMSLRELWLKKLECEAVLSLLEKLEVIRAAPSEFDRLLQPPCRIGAAVLCLSQALATMFSDDIAQVQALHKIMEQLMLRKQRAEEVIWDTLADVLFLRTGNGFNTRRVEDDSAPKVASGKDSVAGKESVASDTKNKFKQRKQQNYVAMPSFSATAGMNNPFLKRNTRFALDEDVENQSVGSSGSGASLFSIEDGDDESTSSGKPHMHNPGGAGASVYGGSMLDATFTGSSGARMTKRMMIPPHLIEAELDLESDERRCLEDIALSGGAQAPSQSTQRALPNYADHVLALRILIECLSKLNRLEDVERILSEGLERELRKIVQREQARTFARLEKQRSQQGLRSSRRGKNDLKECRRHLTGLLSAFGCVMVRLSHLAQILRSRLLTGGSTRRVAINSDKASVLQPVISSAYNIMQREIKEFLKACLSEEEAAEATETATGKRISRERGLFTLGIIGPGDKDSDPLSTSSAANIMELPAGKFVTSIVFPKINCSPQVRHALTFRRAVARWTGESEALKNELALVSYEDTSTPSYRTVTEEPAIEYLDSVIKLKLLPALQEEAVNGTVRALERVDAFDPVLDRRLYSRPNSNEPQDVDMCIACQTLYQSTGPLFMALHRLPRGGEMYLPLVAVLEHVILTFISRVKQRVANICNEKMALRLLMDSGRGGKDVPFGLIVERRKAFQQLMQAYANGDLLDADEPEMGKTSNMIRLAPSANDTNARRGSGDLIGEAGEDLDGPGGVEGEEANLKQELVYLQSLLDFTKDNQRTGIAVCSDEELMQAATLAHSLLKLSSLLETRLKVRSSSGFTGKTLTSTRALREAIKTIKANGVKMAKFCRTDVLLQTSTRLSQICRSTTMVARDAVRIPSSVNDLGEYLTGASDNLLEAAGNAVTAYTFSALEQYIPLCLMQTVRVIMAGEGIVTKSPLTLNGVEALDRSGSVLYRDLKGATSFDNSFWDDELAAISFETSATFIATLEFDMEELESYYLENHDDFSDEDFTLMFAMDGPRRRGDLGRLQLLKRQALVGEKEKQSPNYD